MVFFFFLLIARTLRFIILFGPIYYVYTLCSIYKFDENIFIDIKWLYSRRLNEVKFVTLVYLFIWIFYYPSNYTIYFSECRRKSLGCILIGLARLSLRVSSVFINNANIPILKRIVQKFLPRCERFGEKTGQPINSGKGKLIDFSVLMSNQNGWETTT